VKIPDTDPILDLVAICCPASARPPLVLGSRIRIASETDPRGAPGQIDDSIDVSLWALIETTPKRRYLNSGLLRRSAVKRQLWGLTGWGELGFARTRRFGTARLA
jgi:hypothetical protein